MMIDSPPEIAPMVVSEDIPSDLFHAALEKGVVSLDIETTGLDWDSCRICTCQLVIPGGPAVVVTALQAKPPLLIRLLADESVRKVFHHAMFDLRFMVRHWAASPRNIACTKIASKLLHPDRDNHSLKPLLLEYLGVEIDKSNQRSDWTRPILTPDQLAYAVADAAYLVALLDALTDLLDRADLADLYHDCLAHIPARLQLDTRKYRDVFAY